MWRQRQPRGRGEDWMIRGLLASTAAVALLFLPVAASAQQTQGEAAAPPASNRVAYDQAYFTNYSVSNAEDMLRLLPGVPAILDAVVQVQQRGFGSAGARVLIDGRRFPGKTNEINTTLRRIAPAQVERVELISGSVPGISVQSDGILVNIVLREGASIAGTGSWEATLKVNGEGRAEPDGIFTYNGVRGALSYSLGVERNLWSPPGIGSRYMDRFRDETYYYPNGALLETRPQEWRRHHHKWIYTGGLTYDFARGDRLQLNGLYQDFDLKQVDDTSFTRLSPTGQPIQTGLERHETHNDKTRALELSGEYDSRLGPGDMQGLFIIRRNVAPGFDIRTRQVGSEVTTVGFSYLRTETSEDILRTTYAFPLLEGHYLEVGGELARNSLTQDLEVGRTPTQSTPIPTIILPTAKVKELRGEAFVTHRWTVSPKLSLESTLTYEVSRLSTNFAFIPERTLTFLRPRLDLRYRPGGRAQYRLLLDRSVSQLDFNNFVPRFDQSDPLNPKPVAGNPQIEPEKTWTFEAGYERRLPGDAGLLEARGFYKDITDAIDRVPLCSAPLNNAPLPGDACVPGGLNRLYSASGNIPTAKLYGAEVKASVRLGMINLPAALLSVTYLRQHSEIEDPFARLANLANPSLPKEIRTLSTDRGYNLTVAFRHDVRSWGASYGFTYQRYGWTTIASDLLAREYYWVGPTLDAFVEKRLSRGLTLRVEVQNLIDREDKTRLLYAQGAVAGGVAGPLLRFEQFRENRDTRTAIRLRGRF
jgi:outer membrane receptor protein involved in Fe transport